MELFTRLRTLVAACCLMLLMTLSSFAQSGMVPPSPFHGAPEGTGDASSALSRIIIVLALAVAGTLLLSWMEVH